MGGASWTRLDHDHEALLGMMITMEMQHVQLAAGIASSSPFVFGRDSSGALKAFRTRDLKSYCYCTLSRLPEPGKGDWRACRVCVPTRQRRIATR